MGAKLELEVTERVFIKKYAEGVDPATGQPFEIYEPQEIILKGQAAVDRLHELGVSDEKIEELKEAGKHATN